MRQQIAQQTNTIKLVEQRYLSKANPSSIIALRLDDTGNQYNFAANHRFCHHLSQKPPRFQRINSIHSKNCFTTIRIDSSVHNEHKDSCHSIRHQGWHGRCRQIRHDTRWTRTVSVVQRPSHCSLHGEQQRGFRQGTGRRRGRFGAQEKN